MKIFHCGNCDQLVFFENTTCVSCGNLLAHICPIGATWASFDSTVRRAAFGGREPSQRSRSIAFLCELHDAHNVCNWALPEDDPESFLPLV